MSHDTNHGHPKENTTIISFKNSFWLIIIIVGLFIAALNFMQAESGGEEGKAEVKEKTEAAAPEAKTENAPAEQKADAPKQETPAADSTKK